MNDLSEAATTSETTVDSGRGFPAALHAIRNAVTVATFLRTLGAAAMVASISVFLLQGFDTGNDLTRVFMLLAQSGLLAATGLLVGFVLHEPKGARVFLSLALVSVPANFAVLAAMTYSIAPLDGGLAPERYPEFARWQVSSFKDLGIALLAGLALLVPTTAFAFKVLARRLAVPLSMGLLAGSAVLLLPVRDPTMVALVTTLLVLGTAMFLLRVYRQQEISVRLMTFEERLATLMLFIAPGIMTGRSLIFHGVSEVSSLALTMGAYCLLFSLMRLAKETVKRQILIAVLAVAAGTAVAVQATHLLWGILPSSLFLPGFAVILGALLYLLAARSELYAVKQLAAACWTITVLLAVIAGAFLAVGLLEIISVFLVAMAVAGLGLLTGSKWRTVIGLVGSVGVLLQHIDNIIPLFIDAGWIALAALGVITIVAGSLLERFGPALRLRFTERASRFSQAGSIQGVSAEPISSDDNDLISVGDAMIKSEKIAA